VGGPETVKGCQAELYEYYPNGSIYQIKVWQIKVWNSDMDRCVLYGLSFKWKVESFKLRNAVDFIFMGCHHRLRC